MPKSRNNHKIYKMNKYFFILAFGFSFLFFSCGSSKELVQEKTAQLEPVTLELIQDFKISETTLYGLQFFSSTQDTIVLQNQIDATSSRVGPDGVLVLTGGNPSKANIILPGTPGVLVGLVYEQSNEPKNIKELKISYSANKNNYLIYRPSQEDGNTFLLQESKFLVSGELSQVYIVPFYLEQQDQKLIEPGQKVGQKKAEKSPVKKTGKKYDFQN